MSGSLPSYPWSSGQPLGAAQLDAAFNNVYALYNNLATVIGTIQATGSVGGPVGITVNWSGLSVVTPGIYIVELFAPFALTISSINYAIGTNGGSFSVSVLNAGVAVTGLSTVPVSNIVVQTALATGNNVVAQGTTLELSVSGVVGNPTGSVIQINGTRQGNAVNSLPVASSTTLGGVIAGSGLSITGAGVLSTNSAAYSLPSATTSVLGGVIVGNGLSVSGGLISANIGSTTQQGILNAGTGLTTSSGTVNVLYGTTANTSCQGNDSRISGAISAASPALTGIPTAPTASLNTSSTQIATTAFVINQGYLTSVPIGNATTLGLVSPDGASITNNLGSISVTYGTTSNTAAQGNDSRIVNAAPLSSPQFGGTPLLTSTPTANSNGLQIANTLYVDRAIAAATTGVSSVVGQTGIITLANLTSGGVASLASPSLTGVPLAPTATGGTNTTQIATTQFVTSAVSASTTGVSQVVGNTGAVTLTQLVTGGVAPLANPTFTGVVTIPTGASITGYAPLTSPILTGIPAAPNAAAGTSTSQIATTQFVTTAITNSTTGVSQVLGNTGAITLTQLVAGGVAQTTGANTFTGANTYSANQTFGLTSQFTGVATFVAVPILPAGIVNYAPLASPSLTGVPLAPTATGGTNTTQIATTQFVTSAVSASTTGVSQVLGNTGSISLTQLVTGGVAPLASPVLTGTPTVPGYLTTAIAASTYAPLASPVLTGTPTIPGYLTIATAASTYAPLANATMTGALNLTGATVTAATAALGTNSTQVATTAFVYAALNNDVVGSIGAGLGPGFYYADNAGNMTVKSAYPGPVYNIVPVAQMVLVWTPPVTIIITGLLLEMPNVTSGSIGFTVTCYNAGVAMAGLTNISITGTTGALTTNISGVTFSAGGQFSVTIVSITGVMPAYGIANIQPIATYG